MKQILEFIKGAGKYYGGFLVVLIIFIAGICCKENSSDGFESFVGWAAMAVAVMIVVIGIYLYKKKKDSADK